MKIKKKQILSILALTLLFACSPSPKKVAQGFVENFAKGDIEATKALATEQTGALIDFATSMGTAEVDPDFEFNHLRDSIEKDRAWVFYKDKKGEENTVELIKIDGEWLVNIDADK